MREIFLCQQEHCHPAVRYQDLDLTPAPHGLMSTAPSEKLCVELLDDEIPKSIVLSLSTGGDLEVAVQRVHHIDGAPIAIASLADLRFPRNATIATVKLCDVSQVLIITHAVVRR